MRTLIWCVVNKAQILHFAIISLFWFAFDSLTMCQRIWALASQCWRVTSFLPEWPWFCSQRTGSWGSAGTRGTSRRWTLTWWTRARRRSQSYPAAASSAVTTASPWSEGKASVQWQWKETLNFLRFAFYIGQCEYFDNRVFQVECCGRLLEST